MFAGEPQFTIDKSKRGLIYKQLEGFEFKVYATKSDYRSSLPFCHHVKPGSLAMFATRYDSFINTCTHTPSHIPCGAGIVERVSYSKGEDIPCSWTIIDTSVMKSIFLNKCLLEPGSLAMGRANRNTFVNNKHPYIDHPTSALAHCSSCYGKGIHTTGKTFPAPATST